MDASSRFFRYRRQIQFEHFGQEAQEKLSSGAKELIGALKSRGWSVNGVNVRQREIKSVDVEA